MVAQFEKIPPLLGSSIMAHCDGRAPLRLFAVSTVLVLWLAVGSGCGGRSSSRDSGIEAGQVPDASDGRQGDANAGMAVSCSSNNDCPREYFCGAGTRTCVSAVAKIV